MPQLNVRNLSADGYLDTHGVLDSAVNEIQHGVHGWARTIAENAIEPKGLSGSWDNQLIPASYENSYTSDTSYLPESTATSTPDDMAVSDQQVCYGMIHGQDVKLIGDMANLLSQLNPSEESPKSGIQTFSLEPQPDHILLLLPNGTAFGHLRDKLTKALTPLLRWDSLQFEAVILSQGVRGKISKIDKSGEAIVQVDINIYGPSDQAIKVGDILTEDKLWFQRPDYYKSQFPYENPHVIRFPELEGSMQFEEPGNEIRTSTSRTEVNVLQIVSEINTSTHRADGLERVTGDRRLLTPLLEHQEKALAFMLERESGNVREDFRLWKPAIVDDREMFVHLITKTRCSIRPDEKGGGVLADEMGMGKTLSILALVINTIENGHEWAESRTDEALSHSQIRHHTHSTLVVVPSALLINSWIAEIKLHLGDAVKVTKYHGGSRERDTKNLASADIVLTTYKTLATDHSNNNNRQSPLHRIGWFRVVLDEAHNIRRPSTTFHRSCAALEARSRWCLTGTPIQNKLEDIGALFVFLKAEPFQSMARFRAYLVLPFEQNDPIAKDRLVMLYDSLVLRRSKDILSLPGQSERIRKLYLSDEERARYNKTMEILNRYIRQQVGDHTMKSKFGLFQAHLQLRILCNHGTHQKSFAWKRKNRNMIDEKEAFLTELGLNAERKCSGCDQPRPIIDTMNTGGDFVDKCSHFICRDCLDTPDSTQVTTEPLRHCPICALSRKAPDDSMSRLSNGSFNESHEVVMHDVDSFGLDNGGFNGSHDVDMQDVDDTDRQKDAYFNQKGYSTKMTALVNDVKETLGESVRQEDGTFRTPKSIIFSCWTRTLDLVEVYLKREKIEFLRVDGELLMSKRQQILDQFSRPGGRRIMLMTTGTGAFGLNLTAANRIFIVELQWNPSVENQAIARAIRLRQKDKVIVTRYMITGTVEQEMKSQQIKKEQAARAGFGESRE
ncbi:SNF2 family N-terminal domain-containing protein [Ilyonectria destructans]|nr:SNF2 family N-terminal domain-containing protein [Ilyonectria destructans]